MSKRFCYISVVWPRPSNRMASQDYPTNFFPLCTEALFLFLHISAFFFFRQMANFLNFRLGLWSVQGQISSRISGWSYFLQLFLIALVRAVTRIRPSSGIRRLRDFIVYFTDSQKSMKSSQETVILAGGQRAEEGEEEDAPIISLESIQRVVSFSQSFSRPDSQPTSTPQGQALCSLGHWTDLALQMFANKSNKVRHT